MKWKQCARELSWPGTEYYRSTQKKHEETQFRERCHLTSFEPGTPQTQVYSFTLGFCQQCDESRHSRDLSFSCLLPVTCPLIA